MFYTKISGINYHDFLDTILHSDKVPIYEDSLDNLVMTPSSLFPSPRFFLFGDTRSVCNQPRLQSLEERSFLNPSSTSHLNSTVALRTSRVFHAGH